MKLLLGNLLLAVFLLLQLSLTGAGDAAFDALIAKMEADVLELALRVEDLYTSRCDATSLSQCYQGNYNDCDSEFPNQQCFAYEELALPACGDGTKCSALWDYSVSNVVIPDDLAGTDLNPTDPSVIETVCFTQKLDEWFVQKRSEDSDYWNSRGLASPWMYFGSMSGAYRIYPARQTPVCGDYDPRRRPWYIAASSGPKNVILILDTSGSMKEPRLTLMKEAAKQVIQSLTAGDRVAIVQFANQGILHAEQNRYFYEANEKNKETLIKAIDAFEAIGGTNFKDAFAQAFAVLDNSLKVELHVTCNTAILFLTDGVMTEPPGETEENVLTFITDGLKSFEGRLENRPILLFTYSISENDDVHIFPQQIACSVENGVWSKIVDDRKILESLTSYFMLFAIGLGTGGNSDFTAWVEPYSFATGGILGTTVSAPVYDRTRNPPLFLGVVGIDFPLVAVDKALGVKEGSQESIDRIVLTSTAKCPRINLTLCELESFRHRGIAGDDALCTSNCSEDVFDTIEEEPCVLASDLPDDLWIDRSYEGLSYTDRACCRVGETGPSDECPAGDDSSSNAAVIGGAVGGAVGFLALVAVLCYCVRKKRDEGKAGGTTVATSSVPTTTEQSTEPDIPVTASESVLPIPSPPPPSAPFNPDYVDPTLARG